MNFTTQSGKLSGMMFYIKEAPAKFRWAVMNWTDGKPGEVIAEGETTPEGVGWHSVEVEVEVPSDFFIAAYALSDYVPKFGVDTSEPIDWRSWTYDSRWEGWSSTLGDHMIRAEVFPSVQRLTEEGAADRYPCWSPYGEEIVFASDRGGSFDLYRMKADGMELRRLTGEEGHERKPAWSSSQGVIAYVYEEGGKVDLYRVLPDGSGRKRLTEHSGAEEAPCWSPDGVQMLFSADWEGGWEVYRKPLGKAAQRVTASLGENTQPDAGK